MKLRVRLFGCTAALGLALLEACTSPSEPLSPSNVDSPEQPSAQSETRATALHQPAASPGSAVDPDLVRRLGTSADREQAVSQLLERFAQVGRNGTKTPEALAFGSSYAEPATQAYIDGYSDLPVAQRHKLLQLLLSFDNEATTPAFVHAIQTYTSTGVGADDAIWACQAAVRRKASAFQDPLIAAYKAVDTSDKDGLRYSRHLAAALSFQRSDQWNQQFQTELDSPLLPPPRFDDKPAVRAYQSGLFRQTIAVRLLGESRASSALDSLAKVLLDANKADIHPAAELSLAKLGESALPSLVALLNKQGPLVELTAKAAANAKENHVYYATKWLDLIRHPKTETDLLSAWTNTRDPVSRTLLVRSLSRLPRAKQGIDALKTTYVQTDIKVTLPEGESALEVLADSAVQFYDPSLALWLRERADQVPTVWTRRGDVLTTLVINMSRLVQVQDVAKANTIAQKYGGKTGTPAFETAKNLVQSCRENSGCYVAALIKHDSAFEALKAATMAGCFGNAETRDALIDIAVAMDSPELLTQVLASIEELTIDDAKAAFSKLAERSKQQLDSATPTWSRAKRTAIALLLARLESRAS